MLIYVFSFKKVYNLIILSTYIFFDICNNKWNKDF